MRTYLSRVNVHATGVQRSRSANRAEDAQRRPVEDAGFPLHRLGYHPRPASWFRPGAVFTNPAGLQHATISEFPSTRKKDPTALMELRRFGDFSYDGHNLTKNGSPQQLEPQPRRLMELLLENIGTDLTNQQIVKSLWPEFKGKTADKNENIRVAFSALRKVLGDQYLPLHGHRLVIPKHSARLYFADYLRAALVGAKAAVADVRGDLIPSVEECERVLLDLERSLTLSEAVSRKYDDTRMGRERALALDALLSKALNASLAGLEGSAGSALDQARDTAWGIDFAVAPPSGMLDRSAHDQPAELWPAFYFNFAYEVMQALNGNVAYKESYTNPISRLVRHIEFPPEYLQAGMTVLNQFASIVRSKYAHIDVAVKIIQDGSKVTLVVVTPHGEREEIEQTLEAYGEFVAGRVEAEAVVEDKIQAIELRNSLRIAQFQVEQKNEILRLVEGQLKSLQTTQNALLSLVAPLVADHQRKLLTAGVTEIKTDDKES